MLLTLRFIKTTTKLGQYCGLCKFFLKNFQKKFLGAFFVLEKAKKEANLWLTSLR